MKTEQKQYTPDGGWKTISDHKLKNDAQLVLVFGGRSLLEAKTGFDDVKKFYPQAKVVWCSTAGEILGTEVHDDTLALTAIHFEKTSIKTAEITIEDASQSESGGARLAETLSKEKLRHVMVFSDGLKVNGTTLVKGILSQLPKEVSVTGGLVGDGAQFKKTLVGLDNEAQEGKIVLVGFYGDRLKVGYGSLGGWDDFGVERTITKAEGNVLFEMDNKPALQLYKEYLGDQAEKLPGSGLLFPLSLKIEGEKQEIVRTILAVDEDKQSMTFAGDMPEGAKATLMKANFDRLVDGAEGAASMSVEPLEGKDAQLAILISCVGRKLVLKDRVEEEVEAVKSKVGAQAAITGFYSYGELCPTAATEKQCRLHNQTMTITTFKED